MTEDNVVELKPETNKPDAAPVQPNQVKPEMAVRMKEQTVRNLAIVHQLLAEGTFQGRLSRQVSEARMFVEAVHSQAVGDLRADPLYHTTETARAEAKENPK